MIALVDYGAGNLTSVRKALAALERNVLVPRRPSDLDAVAGIIVPGVGHFAATAALDESWRASLRAAIDRRVPLLGICLGLQWLFDGSTEAPGHTGLGVFRGICDRLPDSAGKVPHVGWNSLEIQKRSMLLGGVSNGTQVYFTHAYAAPITSETAAATEYGRRFASAVEHDRIFGVQFHPEKSGDAGLTVLRNFLATATRD